MAKELDEGSLTLHFKVDREDTPLLYAKLAAIRHGKRRASAVRYLLEQVLAGLPVPPASLPLAGHSNVEPARQPALPAAPIRERLVPSAIENRAISGVHASTAERPSTVVSEDAPATISAVSEQALSEAINAFF